MGGDRGIQGAARRCSCPQQCVHVVVVSVLGMRLSVWAAPKSIGLQILQTDTAECTVEVVDEDRPQIGQPCTAVAAVLRQYVGEGEMVWRGVCVCVGVLVLLVE